MALGNPRHGKYPYIGVGHVPPTPRKPARFKAAVAGYGGAIYLGMFDTPQEAAIAVDKAKWLLLYHENRLALSLANARGWNDYESAVGYSEDGIRASISMFVAERVLKIALDRDHARNKRIKHTETPTARLNQLEVTYRSTIDELQKKVAALEESLKTISDQLPKMSARLFALQQRPAVSISNPLP